MLLAGAAGIFFVGSHSTPTFAAAAAVLADEKQPSADSSGELAQVVIELLADKDKDIRALGLEQVRTEAKGEAATKRFAEHLPKLPPDAQVGLLSALADRGDKAAAESVRKLLTGTQQQEVRIAALRAMGALGGAGDTGTLVKALSSDAPSESVARASLTKLMGDDVSLALAAAMKHESTLTRIAIIQILAARRARDTIPELLDCAVADEEAERAAAMIALGQLAEPKHIAAMLTAVGHAKAGNERTGAEKAVAAACLRTADVAQRAAPILAAMETMKPAERALILPTLGRVGGPDALKTVDAALADSEMHEPGARALCNWPDASVAERLLTMQKGDAHKAHQAMALAALIRVAPLPDGRSDGDRIKLVKQVMDLCQRDEDRKLIVQRVRAIRSLEALQFVLPYCDQPALMEIACETIVELAHHRTLREAHKTVFFPALDRVMAISKNATTVERAKRYKNNQTWTRPAAEKE